MNKIKEEQIGQIRNGLFNYGITHPHAKIWRAKLKQFSKEHNGKAARIRLEIELIEIKELGGGKE